MTPSLTVALWLGLLALVLVVVVSSSSSTSRSSSRSSSSNSSVFRQVCPWTYVFNKVFIIIILITIIIISSSSSNWKWVYTRWQCAAIQNRTIHYSTVQYNTMHHSAQFVKRRVLHTSCNILYHSVETLYYENEMMRIFKT
jgi:hypothetical protein